MCTTRGTLIVLVVGLQMQRQCEEGSCREQESVPPNIATCCSFLGTAAKLEINYINNEWSRIDLKSRLCPSCQWDDKVYVESWDSLNDKCPLMQLCKHHRKYVRRQHHPTFQFLNISILNFKKIIETMNLRSRATVLNPTHSVSLVTVGRNKIPANMREYSVESGASLSPYKKRFLTENPGVSQRICCRPSRHARSMTHLKTTIFWESLFMDIWANKCQLLLSGY